jgi:hypothetical protein
MEAPQDSTSPLGHPARRLGSVPWNYAGCNSLSVAALAGVPPSDDSMIRAALIRGARSCQTIGGLHSALNRELWQIGYIARVEHDPAIRAVVLVEVSPNR